MQYSNTQCPNGIWVQLLMAFHAVESHMSSSNSHNLIFTYKKLGYCGRFGNW